MNLNLLGIKHQKKRPFKIERKKNGENVQFFQKSQGEDSYAQRQHLHTGLHGQCPQLTAISDKTIPQLGLPILASTLLNFLNIYSSKVDGLTSSLILFPRSPRRTVRPCMKKPATKFLRRTAGRLTPRSAPRHPSRTVRLSMINSVKKYHRTTAKMSR